MVGSCSRVKYIRVAEKDEQMQRRSGLGKTIQYVAREGSDGACELLDVEEMRVSKVRFLSWKVRPLVISYEQRNLYIAYT